MGVPLIVTMPVVAFPLNTAVHPGGRPVGVSIPVAIVVTCVMFDGSAEPIQRVGVSDAAPTVRLPITTIEPVALTVQFGEPLNGTEKLNVPGVTLNATLPDTVKTLPTQAAVNPKGNPVAVPMPVAPVVA